MLNEKQVTDAIEEIKKELVDYHLPESLLVKFTESKEDKEYKSYVEGIGGSYIRFLPLLIDHLKLKNILELGNQTGMSTLAMYDKLPPDATLMSVDIEKDLRFCPDIMFTDTRVKFVFGDVFDLSTYKSIPYDIDLLFTDTVHNDSQLQDEWSIYQHLLADQALVAIDDINLNDKRKLFDSVPYPKWDLTELCHVSGWGLFLFERKDMISKEERIQKAILEGTKIWRRRFLIRRWYIYKSWLKRALRAILTKFSRIFLRQQKS